MSLSLHNLKSGNIKKIILIILVSFFTVTVIFTIWLKTNIYVSNFKGVNLDRKEEAVLRQKLKRIKEREKSIQVEKSEGFKTEVYREDNSTRIILFSEKELNALLAMDNPEAARKISFKLDEDMISLKIIISVPEDIVVIGGCDILVRAGLSLQFKNEKISFSIKGVSVAGVSLPNSWLGNIKNKDLLAEFNSKEGFFNNFQKGIENLVIKDGLFYVKLKE